MVGTLRVGGVLGPDLLGPAALEDDRRSTASTVASTAATTTSLASRMASLALDFADRLQDAPPAAGQGYDGEKVRALAPPSGVCVVSTRRRPTAAGCAAQTPLFYAASMRTAPLTAHESSLFLVVSTSSLTTKPSVVTKRSPAAALFALLPAAACICWH